MYKHKSKGRIEMSLEKGTQLLDLEWFRTMLTRCKLSARIFELRASKHMESMRYALIFSISEWYKTYVGSN